MNSFNITGKLHKKYETEQKTASFSAREFVIETNENNYVNYIKFQLTQDRCNLIDNVNEQDEITVHFDLRGREWQGRYFTNLNAWKVEVPVTEVPVDSFPDDMNFPEADSSSMPELDQGMVEDDLPF